MESSIGFFGQIKYIVKGIAKPKYFNRLSHQSKGALIGYVIVITIISTLVFWGMRYLSFTLPGGIVPSLKSEISGLSDFSYENGILTFEEQQLIEVEPETEYFIIDTSVAKPDEEYIDRMLIKVDWVNGKSVAIFNGETVTVVSALGRRNTVLYKEATEMLGIPSSFDKAGVPKLIDNIFPRILGIAAAISLVWFLIKAVGTGFLFSGIGFLIIKFLKVPYSYKETLMISFFVTGVTTIFKRLITGSPLTIPTLVTDIIMILIVAAYMFFALTGSTEDIGSTSTVYFDKPGSKSGKNFTDDYSEDIFATGQRRRAGSAGAAGAYQNVSAPTRVPEPAPTPVQTVSSVQAPAPSDVTAASDAYEIEEETLPTMGYGSGLSSVTEVATPEPEATVTYEETYREEDSYVRETVNIFDSEETAYADNEEYEPPKDALSFYESLTGEASTMKSEPEESNVIKPIESTGGIIKSESTYGMRRSEDSSNPLLSQKIGFSGTGGAYSGRGGGYAGMSYDRPITAPDMGMGGYSSSYSSNYGGLGGYGGSDDYSGSLAANRGGLYGKTLTIGQAEKMLEKASVAAKNIVNDEPVKVSAPKEEKPQYGSSLLNKGSSNFGTSYGGSLYHKEEKQDSDETRGEHEELTFTSKWGGEPFAAAKNEAFESLDKKKSSKKEAEPIRTYTKSGKAVNRYSDDDFDKWERENFADEFKPVGGFGRR